MGCTPSIQFDLKVNQQINNKTQKVQKQMVKIQYFSKNEENLLEYDQCDVGNFAKKLEQKRIQNKVKKVKQKIEILQQNKIFMGESIQMSNELNKAIITISNNPFLKDDSYKKLIGINKKILLQKQNRFKNLEKRQQKAQLQLAKQKNRAIKKSKSQILNSRCSVKLNKENQSNHQRYGTYKSNFNFLKKLGTIEQALNESQSLII